MALGGREKTSREGANEDNNQHKKRMNINKLWPFKSVEQKMTN